MKKWNELTAEEQAFILRVHILGSISWEEWVKGFINNTLTKNLAGWVDTKNTNFTSLFVVLTPFARQQLKENSDVYD